VTDQLADDIAIERMRLRMLGLEPAEFDNRGEAAIHRDRLERLEKLARDLNRPGSDGAP
jgi:hypothetical protein